MPESRPLSRSASSRTAAERKVGELTAELHRLKEEKPLRVGEIRRVQRNLTAAWRAVNRMREQLNQRRLMR